MAPDVFIDAWSCDSFLQIRGKWQEHKHELKIKHV